LSADMLVSRFHNHSNDKEFTTKFEINQRIKGNLKANPTAL
jgi:hypothetical protein